MTMRVPNLKRSLRVAVALLGASAALGACTHTDQDKPTSSIPLDYRQRHPIVVQEANHATEVFVGHRPRRPHRCTAFGYRRPR